MSLKRILLLSGIATLCFAALFLEDRWQPLVLFRLRNMARDAVARAGRTTPPNPALVFLAIDSDSVGLDATTDVKQLYGLSDKQSVEAHALELMSQAWPWSREVYALVLRRLVDAGAKVVAFDLTFPTATPEDPPFRLALDRYKEHVVIGSNFISSASRGFATVDASLTRPPESLVPETQPMDDRVAFTNFWPEEDEVVRQAQFRITFEQVQGNLPGPKTERFLSFAAQTLIKAGRADAVPGGLDERLFRFTAPPRIGFRPHSLFEIFVPDYWQHNYQSGEFFRGKIVVIGAEGNWQHDEHPTPFGSMPGPELHLNAINAALHHEFISEMSPLAVVSFTIAAGLLAIFLSLTIRSPWLRLLALIVGDAGWAWFAIFVFNHASVYLPIATPYLQLNLTLLLGLAADFTLERVEKKRVRQALERYVSRDVVREMLDKPKLYEQSLGGVLKRVTILFSDIRGFSKVSAQSDPQVLVRQLNEYLTAMVECVFRFGGTLDKFMGDAVMAVWGNVRTAGAGDDAVAAVEAALAMRAELARLNQKWRAEGLPELKIGVALNHGAVVAGNIGSPQRMEFTVIGDAVNVTWKMQELTKRVGAELIVSKTVEALIVEHFELHPLGQFALHNLPGAWEVFAISEPIAAPRERAPRPLPQNAAKET
ncbi:MAG TPA: adenylate/guanylate cyclase domain-containing protein [Chthoniobacterales bacterium]|nr:adenylate/guanylate cyclase domain-containing protein [Chthoniobacterales bacterium]